MVLSNEVHRKKYNKKFNHIKTAGGYQIGFYQFLSYEKKAGGY